jgi:hypothetical protein
MAFKAVATTDLGDAKKYLWLMDYHGNGQKTWGYVTADAIGVIETAGYLTEPGFKATCQAGDKICIWVVASILDSRTVKEDIRNDLVTYHEVFVIGDTGASATINVTPEIAAFSVEYSIP